MKMKVASALKQPFYLWIIGLFPIFHLYLENYGLVIDREVIPLSAAALSATTAAYILTKSPIPDNHRRAFILAMWSLGFHLSGHIYEQWIMPFSLTVWTGAFISCLLILTRMLKRPRLGARYAQLTPTLNIIATVMLALQLAQLAGRLVDELRSQSLADAYWEAHTQRPAAEKALDSPDLPDIYYIIPDAYPSDAWHLEAMGHDNSAFTQALQELGFQVAAHAQSNYSATKLSLPSTLNMRYIDSNPTNLSDLAYLKLAVNDNALARELLRRGYTYIQLWSGSVGPSPIADINRLFTTQGPQDYHYDDVSFSPSRLLHAKESFARLWVATTLLRTVQSQLEKLLPETDVRVLSASSPEHFPRSLAELETIAQMPQATFTIAHLGKPHQPVVFSREGEIINPIVNPKPEEYFDQLKFVNQKLLSTAKRLIEASPGETVIIMQADHGSTWGHFYGENNRDDTYFDIYAGYYLPPGIALDFPQPYTLINSVPLLFNTLFDTNFTLQEDRFFTLEIGYDYPMDQAEVTREWLESGWE